MESIYPAASREMGVSQAAGNAELREPHILEPKKPWYLIIPNPFRSTHHSGLNFYREIRNVERRNPGTKIEINF